MKEDKRVVELNLDDILPNRFQPRIKFNESALLELSESIKEHGVLQPIIVRNIGDKYEIIVGERRYKASVLAGKTTIPAIISNLNDKDSAEIALIENVQRENLTPIEEAISYKKILDMSFLKQDDLAKKLDKNQSTIANKLRLLNLEIEAQEALLDGKISERHARSLLKLTDRNQQLEMLNKIINERLTVRKTDEAIEGLLDVQKPDVPIVINEPKQMDDFIPHKIIDFSQNISEDNKEDNMNKESNIPTTPIIEDIPEIKPIDIFNLNNEGISQETAIEEKKPNPGFMDIDKIEKEAEDIYQEKPVVDLDMLLNVDKKNETNTEMKESIIEEPKEQENKFFNFNFDDSDESDESSSDELKIKPIDILNNKSNDDEETTNTTSTNPDISSFDFNSFFNPIEEAKENTNIIKDDDLLESVNNETDKSDVDIIDFDDDFLRTDSEEPKESNADDIVSSPIEPLTEERNIEENISEPKYEQFETIPTKETVAVENPANLRIAINTIRNCSKELRNLGYILDVEELDFEDTYQVTFKINKN